MKKEFWTNGESKVEIYQSTETVGNRYSMAGRTTVFNIRPASLGVNGFATAKNARAFLSKQGFKKLS